MDFLIIFIIAIGLSFDTFAASVSLGIVRNKIKFSEAIPIAFIFAIFQSGFILLGYFSGSIINNWLEIIDHWIALLLLSIIGIRMIQNSYKNNNKIIYYNLKTIISLSIGTSIDAFAVGISLGIINTNILLSVFIVGIVTFFVSMIAMKIGKGIGKNFGKIAEIIGGILLILIGIKIVIDHIFIEMIN